jgi:hypothetical protein
VAEEGAVSVSVAAAVSSVVVVVASVEQEVAVAEEAAVAEEGAVSVAAAVEKEVALVAVLVEVAVVAISRRADSHTPRSRTTGPTPCEFSFHHFLMSVRLPEFILKIYLSDLNV